MSTAPKFETHYTVDDYRLWEGDWELCGGVAVAMTPSPFGPHERLVSRTHSLFSRRIEDESCDCVVYAGLDWVVSNDTVVRPDLMVVCGEQPDQHLQRAPCVILEVLSPSTAGKDRVYKRDLYQQQGVGYYLIGDADEATMEMLILDGEGYRISDDPWSETLTLPDGCQLQLERDRLFR